MRLIYIGGLLGLIYIASLAAASPTTFVHQETKFEWAAIGDSWASGVSYNFWGKTDYDGNKDECLRLIDAYSVELSKDNSWVPDGREQNFHFAACSGSKLENMVDSDWRGYKQMDQVGKPSLVIMQAGGNNIGFYDIASNCIFHDRSKDYGPEYPDENGQCQQKVKNTEGSIGPMTDSLLNVVSKIKRHPSVSGNKDFRLYILGYAHFFNIDRPDSDWCNDISFSVNPTSRPGLKWELRQKMNDLVETINRSISKGIQGLNDPRVGFIDISPAFNGTRFCEKGHTLWDQYTGEKVWLWNLSPDGVGDSKQLSVEEVEELNKKSTMLSPLNQYRKAAGWPGPTQNGAPGFALRPFHPKSAGHKAIAKLIAGRLANDLGAADRSGPSHSNQPSPTDHPAPPSPTSSKSAAPTCKPGGPYTDKAKCGEHCPGFECRCQPAGRSGTDSCYCHCK